MHKAHKESNLLINAGNFLLIVSRSRCQLSYPGFSQLKRIQSACQNKTIDSLLTVTLVGGASCPDLKIQAAQAKRAARGAWRRDMAALTGVTRVLATAAALTFIWPATDAHKISGPEKPHGTHASCKDAALHGERGLAALRRCGISQLLLQVHGAFVEKEESGFLRELWCRHSCRSSPQLVNPFLLQERRAASCSLHQMSTALIPHNKKLDAHNRPAWVQLKECSGTHNSMEPDMFGEQRRAAGAEINILDLFNSNKRGRGVTWGAAARTKTGRPERPRPVQGLARHALAPPDG